MQLNDLFEDRTKLSTLTESVNYESMFAALMPYCDEESNENITFFIANAIRYAKRNFKRTDVITWFLRYYRLQIARYMSINNAEIRQIYNMYLGQLMAKTKAPESSLLATAGGFYADGEMHNFYTDTLIHYLNTPVPKIENYRFGFDTWQNIESKFMAWENEWKKSGENQWIPFNPNDDAEVIIDFKDGFAWYLLNRAYCPAEAAAMGHCGNGCLLYTSPSPRD